MGSMKEHPRYNVVSIRISDEELEALREACKESNKSVSSIMRDAMSLICVKDENTKAAPFGKVWQGCNG